MSLYVERDNLHLDKALDTPVKTGTIYLAEKVNEAGRARPTLNSDCVAGLTNLGLVLFCLSEVGYHMPAEVHPVELWM